MARPKLSNMSIAALQNEINRRLAGASKLQNQRTKLAAQLEAIDAELSSLGMLNGSASSTQRGPGRPRGAKNKKKRGRPARSAKRKAGRPAGSKKKSKRGPGRPKGSSTGPRANNKMTLFEALTSVLKGHPMSVSDMTTAVKKAGYKTNASTFRTIVNQTLIKHPKHFKKVERGVYVVE